MNIINKYNILSKHLYLNEQYLQEGIIADKLKNLYHKFTDNLKHILSEAGIDYKKIEISAKKESNNILKILKDKSLDKDQKSNKITARLSSVFKQIKNSLDFEKLSTALSLVVMIVFINTMCYVILSILFGSLLGMIALTVVVAPIVEEYMKKLAVDAEFPYLFTTVLNIVEFSLYFNMGIKAGVAIPKILLSRIPPVFMHYATTFVQKYFRDKHIEDPDTEDRGYVIAVMMHSLWNFLAISITIK